jgi:hypothetical protein
VFYDIDGGRITAIRAYFPISVLVQTVSSAAG